MGTLSVMTLGVPRSRRSRRSQRGQSLAEFGLVAPIVIVLFLTVADFGRIFSTLVVLEALPVTARRRRRTRISPNRPAPGR